MWYFAPQTGYSEAYLGKAGSDSLFFMEAGGPTEKQAVVLTEALNVHEQTGLTPSQLAADLAAAQQEIARLRAALGEPEALARKFHEAYERLAPSFGYETRPDTRAFDPTTPNGRLMVAVCAEALK